MADLPKALLLPDEQAYRDHFHATYCRRPAEFPTSSGNAKIYFSRDSFDHAFFESSRRDGEKDDFSLARACRMPLIGHALSTQDGARYAGWLKKESRHDQSRCVCVVTDDFVVVLRLGLTSAGLLRGDFVTCYVADNSIGKIRSGPLWDEDECMRLLNRKGR